MLRLHFAEHIFAQTILKSAYQTELNELRATLESIEIALNKSGPFTSTGRPKTPKRHVAKMVDGKEKFVLKPASQKGINTLIKNKLRKLGWTSEPIAVGKENAATQKSRLKGDFAKNGVFVEVEFGNVASMFRDLFKFLIAYDNGQAKVGILVVASARLGLLFDSGVADYEGIARNVIPYLRITPLPILFVGIDYDEEGEIVLRHRYDEMYEVATANNLSCFTSEEVFGGLVDELDELEEDSESDED